MYRIQVHVLGKEERFIWLWFCVVTKYKRDFHSPLMDFRSSTMLVWKEINSQGGKTGGYCSTECCRCSDEGAVGLETHWYLGKLGKIFYLETTLLICHFLYLSDLLLILYY